MSILLENLDNLQRIMDQNAYRYNYSMSFAIFGVSDGHCVNLMNYKNAIHSKLKHFCKITSKWNRLKTLKKSRDPFQGIFLARFSILRLRTESRNEVERVRQMFQFCVWEIWAA